MGALMSCAAKGAAMAIAIKISRQIRRILTTIAPMDQCGFAFIPHHTILHNAPEDQQEGGELDVLRVDLGSSLLNSDKV